ncbi:unnamed protein product [Nippostrongylus brasiliensis]|uniref:Uncharacterized protein n=1 Tax=Nippostrongylus brasiliensis TaxID=27835 RepID=A0A0N4XS38_NIPBR|nr:unnamed protein product [Nippostrongylus brasiliensis]
MCIHAANDDCHGEQSYKGDGGRTTRGSNSELCSKSPTTTDPVHQPSDHVFPHVSIAAHVVPTRVRLF